MSILQKTQNEENNKKEMMQRIYYKIKGQLNDLVSLKVKDIRLNLDFSLGPLIELSLKNHSWFSIETYYIMMYAKSIDNIAISLDRYYPETTYFEAVANESNIEDILAQALLRYKGMG